MRGHIQISSTEYTDTTFRIRNVNTTEIPAVKTKERMCLIKSKCRPEDI